jgi:uncharacterized protein
MPVTALYASLLGLWLLVLSFRVIRTRGTERVSLGAGGSTLLERRIRAHANFAEYVPVALILIGLLEIAGASAFFLHLLGLLILAGRLLHGYALSFTAGNMPARVGGMALTFASIGLGAFLNIAWLFLVR